MHLQSDFQIALNWLLNWKNDNVTGHAPPPPLGGLKISEKSLLGRSEIFIWVGSYIVGGS